jgi:hypothetical protein
MENSNSPELQDPPVAPLAIEDLHRLPGVKPERLHFEHTGVLINRNTDIDSVSCQLMGDGFGVAMRPVTDGDCICFMQREGERIALVDPAWLEIGYTAYAVRDRDEYQRVAGAAREAGAFETLDQREGDRFCYILVRHRPSGAGVEIVWRQKQFFADVFPEDPTTDQTELTEEPCLA